MNNIIPNIELHGKFLWVGIGCQRDTSWQLMATAIEQVCREYQLDESAIAGIATIDTKSSEVGLLELCRIHHWPLKTFSAESLQGVCVPNPAQIVATKTGTPSVAEAAAILASAYAEGWEDGEKLSSNQSLCLTASLTNVEVILLVTKQVFHLKGEPGAVTLAVAYSTTLRK